MSNDPLITAAFETVRLGELSLVTNLLDGWKHWRGFVPLLPEEWARTPRLFLVTDKLDNLPKYRQDHFRTGQIDPIGCHFLRDVAVSGHLYLFSVTAHLG